jgi:hypothetical protein
MKVDFRKKDKAGGVVNAMNLQLEAFGAMSGVLARRAHFCDSWAAIKKIRAGQYSVLLIVCHENETTDQKNPTRKKSRLYYKSAEHFP